jgi:2-methylcitrate dehydratase
MNQDVIKPDDLLVQIASYIHTKQFNDPQLLEKAKLCLLDSLACAMLALKELQCKNMLGPIIPGTIVPLGSRVPGTEYTLDPILATFNNSTMIRWLDFNDTWLAAEWGHPSDNIGAILAVADYMSQLKSMTMFDVFQAIIKAYEIQGILALKNSFNAIGLDHVILVKIACTGVASYLLGNSLDQTINALSNAWIDGHSLRTYRHGVNTGPRKSWAAGDAAARGVRFAWLAAAGEPGYPQALDAKQWGFRDALWQGKQIVIPMPFQHYVIDNILFKVKYPAEFHAQTALEAAILLHPQIHHKIDQITSIKIFTQSAAMRIINKTGVLRNYADRDHCIQYIVAVGLIFGDLTAASYTEQFAADPRIDQLREKMLVIEDQDYSIDYLDPAKRSIANAVLVFFADGSNTDKIEIKYPLGHKIRRMEALPFLHNKYSQALKNHFNANAEETLLELWSIPAENLAQMQVKSFVDLWI